MFTNSNSSIVFAATLAAIACTAATAADDQLVVAANPAEIFIERGDVQQLNFDFVVENRSSEAVTLKSIEMTALDPHGKLMLRRDVDGSGAAPAIETVLPDREYKPGSEGIFFNPFTTFAVNFPLHDLRYQLSFETAQGRQLERNITVHPIDWKPATRLVLPLQGRVWVKHGHDYLSHHRRWNPFHPIAKSFGATAIFARYGLDLMIVDPEGRVRNGQSNDNSDFLGWGASVRAPAAGAVVAAHDSDADDDISTGKSGFDPERLPKEPLHFYGNYVIIDHGHREFSLLGHLQHGSVRVKPGDRVTAGQLLAKIGASGSAEFEPHLHFELRRGATMSVEGIPAYFSDFDRLRGSARERVNQGPVNSGEFVSATQ